MQYPIKPQKIKTKHAQILWWNWVFITYFVICSINFSETLLVALILAGFGVLKGSLMVPVGTVGSFWPRLGECIGCVQSREPGARNEAKKKVVLFPENGPPAQNKQVKETRIQKKQKKLKKKRLYLRKINLKKLICGRPGKDFSRHPHFRKQVFFFFWPVFEWISLLKIAQY